MHFRSLLDPLGPSGKAKSSCVHYIIRWSEAELRISKLTPVFYHVPYCSQGDVCISTYCDWLPLSTQNVWLCIVDTATCWFEHRQSKNADFSTIYSCLSLRNFHLRRRSVFMAKPFEGRCHAFFLASMTTFWSYVIQSICWKLLFRIIERCHRLHINHLKVC